MYNQEIRSLLLEQCVGSVWSQVRVHILLTLLAKRTHAMFPPSSLGE